MTLGNVPSLVAGHFRGTVIQITFLPLAKGVGSLQPKPRSADPPGNVNIEDIKGSSDQTAISFSGEGRSCPLVLPFQMSGTVLLDLKSRCALGISRISSPEA